MVHPESMLTRTDLNTLHLQAIKLDLMLQKVDTAAVLNGGMTPKMDAVVRDARLIYARMNWELSGTRAQIRRAQAAILRAQLRR
jgi:hypothetical protein